jgi:hypothetical protein
VHVHVPQSGNQKLAPAIDYARTGRYLRARRGTDVGHAVPGNEYHLIRASHTRRYVDHRHVGYRDRLLSGGSSAASRRRQKRNRDYRTDYLVRFTRQFPV